MLILIAGITGNVGQKLATSAFKRNHQVRGLGRDSSKLPSSLSNNLESFITSKNYYDVPALEAAVQGVDAIVCAYQGTPELQLDGHLLLLRAGERAGVKIFHAATWNYDWRRIKLTDQESYDPYIMFARQVELSSTIRPVYMLSGVLAEVLFSLPGRFQFSPQENHGVWDPVAKKMVIYGTGDETWQWTTEADAAEYSIEIVTTDPDVLAGKGGVFQVCSGQGSVRDIARIYEEVRGRKVEIECVGDVEDLRREALQARESAGVRRWYEYIGWFYQLYSVDESWNMQDVKEWPGVKRTDLATFLRENPDV